MMVVFLLMLVGMAMSLYKWPVQSVVIIIAACGLLNNADNWSPGFMIFSCVCVAFVVLPFVLFVAAVAKDAASR